MQVIQLRSTSKPDSEDGAAPHGEAWIDMEVGDDEGRRWLAGQSGLDEEVIRRLLDPAPTSYWRRFGRGLHLHVRAALPGGDGSTTPIVAFGIWLEPDRIITVRHGKMPALDRAAQACSEGEGPSNPWELVAFVLSDGLNRLERNLHDLTATIDRLEDEVMTGEGAPPIQRVADLQQQLVYARRFRMPLANMISFISSQSGPAVGDPLRDDLEEMMNVFAQHQELLGLSIDRASAMQAQIRDQLADSMNKATYRFTWVATVFLPLGFVTGLLGMSVAGVPGEHDPVAFWLVCGALCVIGAAWGVLVHRLTGPFRRPRGARQEEH